MGCKKKNHIEHASVAGKVAAVTGANSGMGLETTKELNLRGIKVYMLCRNEQRANDAKQKLVEAGCDASRLIYSHCDLSKLKSVRECVTRITEAEHHLDILINNAGVMFYPQHELTEDGHEMTWQSNHLGPFLLTELLLPLLKRAEEGRVVIVSSQMHKMSDPLDLSTVNDKKSFGRFAPYNRSKLANVMYAKNLAHRLGTDSNVIANSLHPGVVVTDLHRHIPFGSSKAGMFLSSLVMKSERDGAQTALYLGLSSEVRGVSGGYFNDCARAKENPASLDEAACDRLYEYSRQAVGLDFEKL